jgi:hypothetical protein
MKKNVIVLIFAISLLNISAVDVDEFFQLSTFRYKLAAFNGSGYYPNRTNKEFQYLEKMRFNFGWKYYLLDNSTIWIDLSYENDLLDKQIILKSTGITYEHPGWEFHYLYSPLEYGKHSQIFDLNVLAHNYDEPVLLDYRFQGIKIKKIFPGFSLTGALGGNQINAALVNLSLQLKTELLNAEFYTIYSGRNDLQNEKTINLGTEIKLHSPNVYCYSAGVLSLQMESDIERFDALQEIIKYPFDGLFLGSNLVYSTVEWKRERNWTTRSILGFNLKRLSFIFSYEYQNTEAKLEYWGNRKTGLLAKVKLNRTIELGLDMNYNYPTYTEAYYQLGLQGKVSYEIH